MSFNLSELFERVVDAVPDRDAVVTPERRLTYRELDGRATRLAHHLAGTGVGAGDHVGVHLGNGTEYLETMLAAFKLRAVPVNINYRYVARELAELYRYLDLVAVVTHGEFAETVAGVASEVPSLRLLIVADDGSGARPAGTVDYETALAEASEERNFPGRSGDDIYIACTGGTTGLPKGVMWRHEDIFFVSMGGGDPTTMEGPISSPDEIAGRVPDTGMVMLVTPPLMHVAAHWTAFNALFGGGKAVFPPRQRFDAGAISRLVAEEGVNLLVVVGNAMLTPILDELEGGDYDMSSLFAVGSGGAILSKSVKDRLTGLLPTVMILDAFGSTETGVAKVSLAGGSGAPTEGARISADPTIAVLDDQLRPLGPGEGVGRLARKGRVPLGYYHDEEKTAATFVTDADGVRWVLPGDVASVEDDDTILLHGRGSVSINTGGEKVFPEEVESVMIGHPKVRDVIVVGLPDDRWGQKVVAVIEASGEVSLDELQEYGRADLAGYKVPKDLVVLPDLKRNPNGKPDYGWVTEQAIAALE